MGTSQKVTITFEGGIELTSAAQYVIETNYIHGEFLEKNATKFIYQFYHPVVSERTIVIVLNHIRATIAPILEGLASDKPLNKERKFELNETLTKI
jgi:hypothetical protein